MKAAGDSPRSQGACLSQFRKMFANGATCGTFWWDMTDQGMDERILGLCFMAAMVEAGDA
jgi:hypothetical protein